MNEIARRAHAAIVAKDWATVSELLHPYLHWTGSDGRTMRGRSKVIAALAHAAEAPAPPASVELRDGQIYRWRSCQPSGTRLPSLPQAADAAEHDALLAADSHDHGHFSTIGGCRVAPSRLALRGG